MNKKKTSLCLYGMLDGEKKAISQDLKNVSNAAKYTSQFYNEQDLIDYFREKTGVAFSNITLEKRNTDPNKKSTEHHIFYMQEEMYCTIDNLSKIFINFASDESFVKRLKNDKYITKSFEHMNSPQNILYDVSKENEQRIRKERGNIDKQYLHLKRQDMKHFLEGALYTSRIKEKRKPKMAIIRYLFAEYVPKANLMKLVKELNLVPKNINYNIIDENFINTDFMFGQIQMDYLPSDDKELKEVIENKKEKEIRVREDDLYPINEKFGDGNLVNPEYVEYEHEEIYSDYEERGYKKNNQFFRVLNNGDRVSINWRGKDLNIRINHTTYLMSPSSAFKKWMYEKEMLKALRDFIDRKPTKEKSKNR